jgi:hypothetical protein
MFIAFFLPVIYLFHIEMYYDTMMYCIYFVDLFIVVCKELFLCSVIKLHDECMFYASLRFLRFISESRLKENIK